MIVGQTLHQGFVESLEQGFRTLDLNCVQVDICPIDGDEKPRPIEGRAIIIDQLRPYLKDKMPDSITWEDVEASLVEMSIETLREGLSEIETFWARLVQGLGPLAVAIEERGIFIERLRFVLKDKMPDGITWEDVEASLKKTSLEKLREGLSDPATFWTRLVEEFCPLAIKLALEKAKTVIIPQMPRNMQWLDAKTVLVNYCSDAFTSIEELKDALRSLAGDEQLQKRFILALARVSLEKRLPTELDWSDTERFAEKRRPEDLRAAVAEPAGRGLSVECSEKLVSLERPGKPAFTPVEAALCMMPMSQANPLPHRL